MDSSVGLAIQCVGVLLITLLCHFLRRSIHSASLTYWTAGWTSLSVALVSLFIGFHTAANQRFFYGIYFLGEYVFGLMILAGCRHRASGGRLTSSHAWVLLPAVAIAAVLPFLSRDFNDLFMVQSLIMAGLLGAALFSLRPLLRRRSTPGLRVMVTALLLLTLDFVHYVPVFAARKGPWAGILPLAYLQFTSIIDLLLEVLLGFGIVMVLMEAVRRQVEAANEELVEARDRLEFLARMDPLTEALNRHAFHSLLSREDEADAETSGSVAIIDIDNLKPINDSLGHNAGDSVIRLVARVVRSLIRADDMLFRWGGDEFLVLMFNMKQSEATRRMQMLNQVLEQSPSDEFTPPGVTVSFGVGGFDSLTAVGKAIEKADRAMYESRQKTRWSQRSASAARSDR
jgi:diguanylate cyclase